MELYDNVKDKEFIIKDLPEGVEKKIHLGRQWQVDIPYAGDNIKAYWCHEDWLFPHKWSEVNTYQGKFKKLLKEKTGHADFILEAANMNSEAFRDRERKVLVAWEKFTASAKALNIKAWAKFFLWTAAAIALVLFIYYMFGPGPSEGTTAQIINNGSTLLIR